jgi:hypothetical protein
MRIDIYIREYDFDRIKRYCDFYHLKRSKLFVNGALKMVEDGSMVKKETKPVLKSIIEPSVGSNSSLCKHGSRVGLCRYGC